MLQHVLPQLHSHISYHAKGYKLPAVIPYTEEELPMQDNHNPYTHLIGFYLCSMVMWVASYELHVAFYKK